MRWSERDRRMAIRRVSPGAKLAIFLTILVTVGLLAFFGWKFVSDNFLNSESDVPAEITAGEEFEPGASVNLFDTETEAVLDGVEQKVQAVNPTDEWVDALAEVDCDDSNVCTAPAPAGTVSGGDGGGISFDPNSDDFLGTGLGLSAILGMGILMWMIYTIIQGDGNN